MFTHRANGIGGGSQGFAHVGERHRTSYHANMLPLSAQSPVQQSESAVRIRMHSTNPPNGYRGWLGQADQYLATQQDHPSGHNGQSYGQVGGPGEGHRPIRREVQEYRDESRTPLGNRRPFSPLSERYTIGTLTISNPHSCNLLNTVLENAGRLYSPPLSIILQQLGMPDNPTDSVLEGLRAIKSWLELPTLNAHTIFRLLFLAQAVSLTLGYDSRGVREKLWCDGKRLVLQIPLICDQDLLCYHINRLYGISETRQQLRSVDLEETFAFQTCAELFTRKFIDLT